MEGRKIKLSMGTPAECLLIHYMLSSATLKKNNRLKLKFVETGVLDAKHELGYDVSCMLEPLCY